MQQPPRSKAASTYAENATGCPTPCATLIRHAARGTTRWQETSRSSLRTSSSRATARSARIGAIVVAISLVLMKFCNNVVTGVEKLWLVGSRSSWSLRHRRSILRRNGLQHLVPSVGDSDRLLPDWSPNPSALDAALAPGPCLSDRGSLRPTGTA